MKINSKSYMSTHKRLSNKKLFVYVFNSMMISINTKFRLGITAGKCGIKLYVNGMQDYVFY